MVVFVERILKRQRPRKAGAAHKSGGGVVVVEGGGELLVFKQEGME